MRAKIQSWGNSQGLRLTKALLEDAQIAVGDEVYVTARDGMIIIAPANRVRGRQDLRELVKRIPKGFKAKEMNWGKSVGKEAW